MNKGLFRLCFVLIIIPVKLFGNEVSLYKDPEYFLKQAALLVKESPEPANIWEYTSLLQLANHIAGYDKSLSVELFGKAFTISKNTKEQIERLNRLELLALYAAPVDGKISTDSLLLIKLPEGDYQKDWRIQLKMLAIEYVLACKQNLPQKEEILKKAEEFCKEHTRVNKTDIVSYSSTAFAEYVCKLIPELSKSVWTRMYPERAWENRLWLAENNLYASPKTSVPELLDLLESGPDNHLKIRVAADLYYAGQKEQAFAAFAQLKPEGIGRGNPLGDLLSQIAISNPDEAIEFSLKLGSEDNIRDAMSIVLAQVATYHPDRLLSLEKYMDNENRKSVIFQIASQSCTQKGDLESARKFADAIKNSEERYIAVAAIAAAAKENDIMVDTLKKALRSGPRGMNIITASAVSLLGVTPVEDIISNILPELAEKNSRRDISGALAVISQYDPASALNIFKKLKIDYNMDVYTYSGNYLSELLPSFAYADPNFTENILKEFGPKLHPQTYETLKLKCAEGAARRSIIEGRKFASRLGIDIQNNTFNARQLPMAYRINRIVEAPEKVEQLIKSFDLQYPYEKRTIIDHTILVMLGRDSWHYCDIDGLVKLSNALEDTSLSDDALYAAALRVFDNNPTKAIDLLNKVKSPWRRAEGYRWFAITQFYPRPSTDRTFLTGFEKSNGFF